MASSLRVTVMTIRSIGEEQKLEHLASKEARELRDALRQLMPHELTATVLLHQPVADSIYPGGWFTDVGPYDEESPVRQAVHSGSTGRFFELNEQYALNPIPSALAIDERSRQTYEKENPPEERLRQVAVERQRHRSVKWDSDRLPPRVFIHHVPLAAPVLDLLSTRVPSLGLVYALTATAEIDDTVTRLVRVAEVAGREAMRVRMHVLFGSRFERALRVDARTVARVIDKDQFAALLMVFVLTHHWWYPFDTVAAKALHAAASTPADYEQAYAANGWLPPFRLSVTTAEPAALEQLAADFLQLARHAIGRRVALDSHFLQERFYTVINLLAGRPHYVDDRDFDSATLLVSEKSRDGDYVALIHRPDADDFSCEIPVFHASQVRASRRNARTPKGQKSRRALRTVIAPGDIKPRTALLNLKPAYVIERIAAKSGGWRCVAREYDGEPCTSLIRKWSQARLEEWMDRLLFASVT